MKNEMILAGDSYTDSQVISGTVVLVQSLDGNELQYDTLDATLDLGGLVPTLFKPADADGLMTSEGKLLGVRPLIRILVADPTSYRYGATVLYKHNGNLVGKYYMTSMKRVAKTQYSITCVSPVGLLANSKHYGGIYAGTRFSALIGEIIGGVVPFSVAPELADQPVYGWLPIAPRRDNLHQALFAMGAAAQKDANGDLYISPLSDDLVVEIPDNRVYTGGSLSYPDTVTQVSIAEHTYVANAADQTVTLHDGIVEGDQITTPNGISTIGTVVLFTEPMHNLVVENGEIVESGINYAVLAPAAECKLTGQKYTHTVREVTRPETPVANTENKITVSDATLVSIANSENVADRLMAYYSSAKTLSTDFVVGKERAGSAVQINDPFGDATKGIITSMDITMSNTLKAHAEIVADYSPGGVGNFYNELAVISEDGIWTVPAGVSKIRVAVIGGGDGGYSGAQGEAGTAGEGPLYGTGMGPGFGEWGDGGKGGAKGRGGLGGRILILSLNVEEGQTFAIVTGLGGAGGICTGTENTPGSEGTETTFGEYSSADGTRSVTGFADLLGATTYGVPGADGLADGSNGTSGDPDSDEVSVGADITIGDVTYVSGSQGKQVIKSYVDENGYSQRLVIAGGGNGGGAAAGSNGGDGADGQAWAYPTESMGQGGKGGDGATATIVGLDGVSFGSGGQGGNGGGGGGGGASGACISVGTSVFGGAGGSGGMGSKGGNGAPGCVLIYC